MWRCALVAGALGGALGCEGAPAAPPVDHPPLLRCDPAAPLPAETRLPRLTHRQYDATVRDLLGLESDRAAGFLPDPVFGGFDDDAEALKVGDRLARDYRRAAEELAAEVTASPGAMARLVPCAAAEDPGCPRSFLASFLPRAYRRPLDEDELDRYGALFERGAMLGDGEDPFTEGVQLVVEAALQSPHFLYRVDRSLAPGPDGTIARGPYEVASRLSYMLWGTMPDDELFAAAAAGELATPEQIRSQALRMVEDPRAEAVVGDFHAQWLELARVHDLVRDPALAPGFGPETVAAMRRETERFVRWVVFDRDGSLEDLLTEPTGFVDDALAPLYGLDPPGTDEPVETPLDPAERAGLLTQASFLAGHASYDETSPIARGVFVHRRILCTDLPEPPPDVDRAAAARDATGRTTRERIESATGHEPCATCHEVINPAGFAFEGFDAVGRRRTEEDGVPVDTSGVLPVGDGEVRFEGAVELVHALAALDEARLCYARQWFRYAHARAPALADGCDLDRLVDQLRDESLPVKQLMVELTQTRGFLVRGEELP